MKGYRDQFRRRWNLKTWAIKAVVITGLYLFKKLETMELYKPMASNL